MFFALFDAFKDENVWVIDSGASRHMTGGYNQIQTLSEGNSSHSIELGDKKCYPMKGIGIYHWSLNQVETFTSTTSYMF